MILITDQEVGTRLLWRRYGAEHELVEGDIKEFSPDKVYVHINSDVNGCHGWHKVEDIVVLSVLGIKDYRSAKTSTPSGGTT